MDFKRVGRHWHVYEDGVLTNSLPVIMGADNDDDADDGGGEGDVAQVIEKGMADIKADFEAKQQETEERLKEVVSGEVAEKFSETNESISELRETLNKLNDRGVDDPGDEKVQDYEKKLTEHEETIRELQLKLTQIPIGAGGDREETAFQRLVKGTKGLIIRDEKGLRDHLMGYNMNPEEGHRAIDTSLFATGGQLSAETNTAFWDSVIDQTTTLKRIFTQPMTANQRHIDELQISSRSLRKEFDGVAAPTAEAVGTGRHTLTTRANVWPEDITLAFLEDNIEGAGVEGKIMALLTRKYGNDLNDLAWNGSEAEDSSNGDQFVIVNDGFIALFLADADVFSFDASTIEAGSPTQSQILRHMFRNLPVEFKATPGLSYYVPIPFAEIYADDLAGRETQLGDQVTINGLPVLRHFGLPVVPESHLSDTRANQTSKDKAVLTPDMNLYHGVQRATRVESEWQPRAGVVEITIRARNDYEYSTGRAVVMATDMPNANIGL